MSGHDPSCHHVCPLEYPDGVLWPLSLHLRGGSSLTGGTVCDSVSFMILTQCSEDTYTTIVLYSTLLWGIFVKKSASFYVKLYALSSSSYGFYSSIHRGGFYKP